MTYRLVTLLVVVAAPWTVVGCSSATPTGLCNLVIVALRADSTLQPGDPLPAARAVLAIAIDGTVIAVPVIQAPLLDGTIQISGAGGEDDPAERLADCVA